MTQFLSPSLGGIIGKRIQTFEWPLPISPRAPPSQCGANIGLHVFRHDDSTYNIETGMAKGSAACAISNATTSRSFDPRAHPECPIPDYSSQGRTPAFTHLSRIRRTVIRNSEATGARRRACITRLETFQVRDERNNNETYLTLGYNMVSSPGQTKDVL